MVVAHPTADVWDILRKETQSTPDLIELQAALLHGTADPTISLVDGLLYFNRRVS